MDRTLRSEVSWVALIPFAAFAPSYGGAQKKDKPIQTLDEVERNSPPPDDPSVGEEGAPIECTTETNCCKGYACTRDPEHNPASRYCIKE